MVEGAATMIETNETIVMKANSGLGGESPEEKMAKVLHVLRDYYRVIVKTD
jgi:hypothetical protein